MTPLTMMALAAVAALLGVAVGRSQERLLRRAGGPRSTSAMVDVGLARLRWVAPAVVASLVIKMGVSATPSVALAWVPLALVGPWLVAVHYVGIGTADRVLAVTAFFTANGIVVAVAFTGDAGALMTAPLGMALVAGLALLGRRLQPWPPPGCGDAPGWRAWRRLCLPVRGSQPSPPCEAARAESCH